MSGNRAIGRGANPARAGTAGGGSGGAIYTDGNRYTVTIDGTVITGNSATEGGGAVFFVSNDRTGTLRIEHSRLRGNPNAGFAHRRRTRACSSWAGAPRSSSPPPSAKAGS